MGRRNKGAEGNCANTLEWFLFHLILSSCCKYSNNLNNKGNNTSFSVQNITTKAILATAVT